MLAAIYLLFENSVTSQLAYSQQGYGDKMQTSYLKFLSL